MGSLTSFCRKNQEGQGASLLCGFPRTAMIPLSFTCPTQPCLPWTGAGCVFLHPHELRGSGPGCLLLKALQALWYCSFSSEGKQRPSSPRPPSRRTKRAVGSELPSWSLSLGQRDRAPPGLANEPGTGTLSGPEPVGCPWHSLAQASLQLAHRLAQAPKSMQNMHVVPGWPRGTCYPRTLGLARSSCSPG